MTQVPQGKIRPTFEPGFELIIELTDHGFRTVGELVGLEEGEYLIVRLPGGVLPEFRRGSNAVVRFHRAGQVYGFRTSVLNHVSFPAAILFFPWPERVEEHVSRHGHRQRCALKASVFVQGLKLDASVVDLSVNGCRCSIDDSKAGGVLEAARDGNRRALLKLHLPGSEPVINCSLVNVSRIDGGNGATFGLRFDGVENGVKRLIEDCLSSIEKE